MRSANHFTYNFNRNSKYGLEPVSPSVFRWVERSETHPTDHSAQRIVGWVECSETHRRINVKKALSR